MTVNSAGAWRIRRLNTFGVLALTVAGFAMSYGALHSLAVAQGVPPALAWMWPLVIDGFIVAASLTVLDRVLVGRTARYPWLLVLLFSAISVTFNIAHGSSGTVGRLVAAVPPVTLVLAFDLLMRQLRDALTSEGSLRTQLHVPAGAIETPVVTPPSGAVQLSGAAHGSAAATTRTHLRAKALVTAAQQEGRRLTGRELAEQLGTSDSYGRRLLRDLATDPTTASAAKNSRPVRGEVGAL